MRHRVTVAAILIVAVASLAVVSTGSLPTASASGVAGRQGLFYQLYLYPSPTSPPAWLALTRKPPESGGMIYGSMAFGGVQEDVAAWMEGSSMVIQLGSGQIVVDPDGTWIGYDENNTPVMSGTWSHPG